MNDPRSLQTNGASFKPGSGGTVRDLFARVRAESVNLAKPLSEEDCCVQSMPDASPVKWHLAHTTWFFETFILEEFEPNFKPFMPAFRVLFNSYYNGIGDKHPRSQRGLLTRPALYEVHVYRKKTNGRMQALFEKLGDNENFLALVELGLHHEQQHQELILTDIKHLLSQNPIHPAYREQDNDRSPAAAPMTWLPYGGGVVEIGHRDNSFCFDNELPRHRQYLQDYALASRPVTNREFSEFVGDGGYREPQLWLSEGWDWVRANALEHPAYWLRNEDGWNEFTLAGLQALDPDLPAVHLSYFEADAYARWAGARLPTEGEWERAAAACPVQGNFLQMDRLHPRPAGGDGLLQMYGDVWEWTQSSYAPYPGYRTAAGAIGEYNGKFMVNQYVLRGGSCATPAGHVRPSYRNFFPAGARWQFSGIRLAK